jgi:hypothetical protein
VIDGQQCFGNPELVLAVEFPSPSGGGRTSNPAAPSSEVQIDPTQPSEGMQSLSPGF